MPLTINTTTETIDPNENVLPFINNYDQFIPKIDNFSELKIIKSYDIDKLYPKEILNKLYENQFEKILIFVYFSKYFKKYNIKCVGYIANSKLITQYAKIKEMIKNLQIPFIEISDSTAIEHFIESKPTVWTKETIPDDELSKFIQGYFSTANVYNELRTSEVLPSHLKNDSDSFNFLMVIIQIIINEKYDTYFYHIPKVQSLLTKIKKFFAKKIGLTLTYYEERKNE